MCALDFGFGQRAVGGAHSTNNPGLIPASAVYVYTCTDPGVHVHRLGWQVTGTLARGRASSPVKPTSHCVCLDICIYDVYVCVYTYIHLYTYIYIYTNGQKYLVRLFIVDDASSQFFQIICLEFIGVIVGLE